MHFLRHACLRGCMKQIAAKANRKLFEKLKGDEHMDSALVELMQPEIDEAVQKARDETSNVMEAREKVVAVNNAVKKLNM